MAIIDASFRSTVKRKEQLGQKINENEKIVSYHNKLLKQVFIFKEFITTIEKALAMEWKLCKVP